MNTDIEKLLRTGPKFAPPAGLKERLIEQIPIRGQDAISTRRRMEDTSGGWVRRWWPVIAPATVSVACAVVLTAQQGQIRELKASNQSLSQAAAAAEANTAQVNNRAVASTDTSAEMEQEISRLKDLAAKLRAEI